MARLTREQSQALTRDKLIQAAGEVVARYGYDGASVERIADEAGYSKGAFYSNFASKEDVLDHVLEGQTDRDVTELTEILKDVDDPRDAIRVVAQWSDERAAELKWGLLAIEFLRRARRDGTLGDHHRDPFIRQWRDVGTLLIRKLSLRGSSAVNPLNLGGMVLEVTYGGVAQFLEANSSGQMVHDMLTAYLQAYGPASSK